MADLNILHTVTRQYQASLAMIGQAIDVCSESLWTAEDHTNRFWHIAYHALFYTHFYLQTSEADFQPWAKHRKDYQYLGRRPWAPDEKPQSGSPYTKAEVMDYREFCLAEVEAKVPALDLAADSGFSWLKFDKLETQFYNIRHIQHHAGQLADRLRAGMNVGLVWVRPE